METKSDAIHRKLSAQARQLTITKFAHKAAIESDARHAAILATLDVTAERRRSARLDRGHDLALVLGQPVTLGGAKSFAVAAENIRHLQLRAHDP